MESGLVCLIDLAFFNFLLPLVDAMVFPLPFGLPLWAVGPIYANPGPNVQLNEAATHLPWNVENAMAEFHRRARTSRE